MYANWPWYEKAKWLMQNKHITQADIAETLKVSRGAVGHYLNGRREPSLDQVKVIAEVLGEDIDELLDVRELFYLEYREDRLAALQEQVDLVPLLSWSRAAERRRILPRYVEPADERFAVPHPISRSGYALRVSGDGMFDPSNTPTFPPGTVIIVDPELQQAPGDFVIALVSEDQATFRQFITEAGETYLKPLNPRYPLQPCEGKAVIGVVVGKAYERISHSAAKEH